MESAISRGIGSSREIVELCGAKEVDLIDKLRSMKMDLLLELLQANLNNDL